MKYRGREIEIEIIGRYQKNGTVTRTKRYTSEVNMHRVVAASEDEICDKIDKILGPLPVKNRPKD